MTDEIWIYNKKIKEKNTWGIIEKYQNLKDQFTIFHLTNSKDIIEKYLGQS